MAGLCEGGNEPAGSLKAVNGAIFRRTPATLSLVMSAPLYLWLDIVSNVIHTVTRYMRTNLFPTCLESDTSQQQSRRDAFKMHFFEVFVTRISKDFRQKELLPLKLLFFVHASRIFERVLQNLLRRCWWRNFEQMLYGTEWYVNSALFVLYPYLTIHMRELGINVEETAIMSAVTPIVAIVMPPVAGMVADRIGNFRAMEDEEESESDDRDEEGNRVENMDVE
ncbi:hypothetical protein ANN_20871 [Periplaneta americana]|uniref:Major facilitator superfamily associated domain-containing protein n=1 Tax=Periplaneta americana TaxID=6978 RepID=A0ABQ8SDU8_PERAM|nr:hypothetical protein ANN_20871 [Periplaneta americana]